MIHGFGPACGCPDDGSKEYATGLKGKKFSLGRSNLRDVIVVLSCISVYFFPLSPLRIGISLAMLFLGSFLHLLVKGVLIRNTVLCKEGIYRLSRHPYYTSNYLIDTGLCLLSGNTYLVLAYPFLFFWAYGPTMKKEETYLESLYEDQYERYSLETGQVLPDFRSVRHWREFFKGFSRTRVSSTELARIMRFFAVAAFILLINDVKTGGLSNVLPPRRDDYDGFVFLMAVLTLSLGQFIVLRRRKDSP